MQIKKQILTFSKFTGNKEELFYVYRADRPDMDPMPYDNDTVLPINKIEKFPPLTTKTKGEAKIILKQIKDNKKYPYSLTLGAGCEGLDKETVRQGLQIKPYTITIG